MNTRFFCLRIPFLFLAMSLVLCLPSRLSAQSQKLKLSGKISGEVVDADSSKPLTGARVTLYNSADSASVSGAFTNSEGKFSLNDIPFGTYYLKIAYIGFRNKIVNGIHIDEKKNKYKTGKIKIHQSDVALGSVEVSTQREMMEILPDKQVIYVSKNLASYGGTAADVLKTIPSITVDIDNNVSLRTSQNIRFLIDGKQSNMDPEDLLDMLPASEIDRVEIMTNPSAKYDAEGTFGIINIVLKREKSLGYRAQTTVNAGTADKYNASLNTNYKAGKFDAGLSGNYKAANMFGFSSQTQKNFYASESDMIVREQDDFRKNRLWGVRATAGYALDTIHALEFNANYHSSDKYQQKLRDYSLFDVAGKFSDFYKRGIFNDNLSEKIDYTLNYTMKFNKSGHELTSSAYLSTIYRDYFSDYDHQYFSVVSGVIIPSTKPIKKDRSSTNNDALASTLQSDYTLPFADGGKLEAGYKMNHRVIDMDFKYENLLSGAWISDSGRTNFFRYYETTHGLYAMYSAAMWGIQYSLGLRGEWTSVESEQLTTKQVFTHSYPNFFPTIQAKYAVNASNSVNFSVTNRINRPSYKQLNPFINYSDPQELSSGNPLLNAELTRAVELGYWGVFDNFALVANLFYKNTANAISTIHSLLDSVTIFARPENFHDIHHIGSEFVLSAQPVKQFKIDGSFSLYQSEIAVQSDSLHLSTTSFSWNAKLILAYSVGKQFSAQLTNHYHSPIQSPQVKNGAYYTSDVGMKLNLWENSLAMNLKVNDIFKTMKSSSFTNAYYFTLDAQRLRDTRYLILGLTYTFNNYKEKKVNTANEEDEEEFQGESDSD